MISPSRLLPFAALLVAACQPLPHPFAQDVPPPGSPLMSVPDSISLSVAPVRGKPRATAAKLAAAVASALRRREVPASSRTASVLSDELLGGIEEAPAARGSSVSVVAHWLLVDANGRVIGTRSARALFAAKGWEAGEKAAVARLAAASAEQIARLLFGNAGEQALPKSAGTHSGPARGTRGAPQVARGVRILVRTAKGAPRDREAALAKAIRFFLGERNISVVSQMRENPELVLSVKLAVGQEEDGRKPITILWRLLRRDGSEIGKVAQQNDVPARLLDRSWGDLAYIIADAAQGGVLELIARGAASPQKPRKS